MRRNQRGTEKVVTKQEKARQFLAAGWLWAQACSLPCPEFLKFLCGTGHQICPCHQKYQQIRKQIDQYLQIKSQADYGPVEYLVVACSYYLQNGPDVDGECSDCLEACLRRSIADGLHERGIREFSEIPTSHLASFEHRLRTRPLKPLADFLQDPNINAWWETYSDSLLST